MCVCKTFQRLSLIVKSQQRNCLSDQTCPPQSRHVKIENKNFFFACKKNAKGRYITISEVKGNFKNTILVPESGWDEFRDVFDEYTRQCKE